MKKLTFLLSLVVIVTALSTTAFGQDNKQQKKIIYTTTDLKQDYEIIQVITGYSDFSMAIAKDPFLKGLNTAWASVMSEASKNNADAVIGIRIEFANVSQTEVGRVIVYGTAVRFKNSEDKK